MFNFSPEKLFLVGVIALVVLGPNRLPEAARSLGRVVSQLRRMSASFQEEVRGALAEPAQAVHSAASDFNIADIRGAGMRSTVRDILVPPATSPQSGDARSPAALGAPGTPDDPSLN